MADRQLLEHFDRCFASHCVDCGACGELGHVDLAIVAADLGEGAFLAVLCEVCWHRRKYRAHLLHRLNEKTPS